mmetsp:Transcript_29110/g.82047  ORF Transcript_29110/g.82047 Transcript_29110/m.82047 type:complete len:220 (+) Transcript_29110:967-1626(+)
MPNTSMAASIRCHRRVLPVRSAVALRAIATTATAIMRHMAWYLHTRNSCRLPGTASTTSIASSRLSVQRLCKAHLARNSSSMACSTGASSSSRSLETRRPSWSARAWASCRASWYMSKKTYGRAECSARRIRARAPSLRGALQAQRRPRATYTASRDPQIAHEGLRRAATARQSSADAAPVAIHPISQSSRELGGWLLCSMSWPGLLPFGEQLACGPSR